MEEWSYYNFAARSFYIKKRCSKLYSIKIEFYQKKNKKFALSHPLKYLTITYALHL